MNVFIEEKMGIIRLKYGFESSLQLLTLPTPYIPENCIEIKISLNFYFHTSL